MMPTTLRKGDNSQAVLELKVALVKVSEHPLPADFLSPLFDAATELAVMDYQRQVGLAVDGIAGPKTLQVLQAGSKSAALLGYKDLERAATSLNVPLACVRAINEVESRGEGFFSNGLAAILFERHVFYARLKRQGMDVKKLKIQHPDVVNDEPGGYEGGLAEWERLNRAIKIDRAAAIESTSWGLFQIMGFHWKELKYANADDFLACMNRSEGLQLDALVRFLKANPAMIRALQVINFTDFARLYNGVGYAKNQYDLKMAKAFAKYNK